MNEISHKLHFSMKNIILRKLSFSNGLNDIQSPVHMDWSLRGHMNPQGIDILVVLELIGSHEIEPVEIRIVVEGRIPKFHGWNTFDSISLENRSKELLIPMMQSNVDFLLTQINFKLTSPCVLSILNCDFL